MIEIRHFKYFLVLASELHFTQAAKRLHIAQPALSQNIRQLEEELGAELFTRNNHEVVLTDMGKIFYGEAKRTLEQYERSKECLRQATCGAKRSLAIGYTSTSILSDLPQRLKLFHQHYPEVKLITAERPINALIEALHNSQLEIICTDSTVIDVGVESMPTSPLPIVVSLNRHHRLAGSSAPLPLAELAQETFVLPTPYKNYILYDLFVGLCRQAGFEPNGQYYADSAPGGIGLVAANLCVQITHQLPLLRCPESVWQRPLLTPNNMTTMALVWMQENLSQAGKQFIELKLT